ncbi:hypothetical protein HMPREF9545_04012 [Escherichia coli MS 16-3]|nr:hypothetical protein HMPREF9553_03565 [Escherichia coli MS 200-1]EFU56233.1 hypothetical protein HMPREF9545_04012 [Escherichia coli MS 16-3]EGB81894.1 hypothetical protein HMPREF9533_03272 [Escherichia coli MS 60-1]ESE37145.1 hypothetical protein HMPREF1622_01166 [Escherichia coli A35218R]
MPKSWAIGVNKLTGKNSTIIRQATQNATEKTADQFGRVMAFAPRFSAINSLMVLPVACFRGKADQSNIEMCDAFNVFATFTMLLELELRSKRNRAKITGCGVNALSTHQVRRGL